MIEISNLFQNLNKQNTRTELIKSVRIVNVEKSSSLAIKLSTYSKCSSPLNHKTGITHRRHPRRHNAHIAVSANSTKHAKRFTHVARSGQKATDKLLQRTIIICAILPKSVSAGVSERARDGCSPCVYTGGSMVGRWSAQRRICPRRLSGAQQRASAASRGDWSGSVAGVARCNHGPLLYLKISAIYSVTCHLRSVMRSAKRNNKVLAMSVNRAIYKVLLC